MQDSASNPHHAWVNDARREFELFADRTLTTAHASAAPFDPDRGLVAALAQALPGYEVCEPVGRGGQGVVLRSLQRATRRDVAIKVLRAESLAHPATLARFEREVQILGQLKHPNIVTIYESGSAAGHFFYIMDYIRGESLDRYVHLNKLSVRGIVQLFVKVCDAVNAAHLRGIIHRDLKPSNIRVNPSGAPHVLDFGLAKVHAADVLHGSSAALTQTGEFVGSLMWASPEQISAAPDRVDLRTDVYALGAMLFQSLTGQFPCSVTGQLRDVIENICSAEPSTPSGYNSAIDDDLDTVILKCLRKSPEERYQSAGELGRDLSCYLAGDAIEAKRDSLRYMLRKHMSRHKWTAATLLAFAVIIAAGFVTSLTFWQRAVRQRDRARDAELLAESRRADATAARDAEKLARISAEKANEISRRKHVFLSDILTSVDPSVAQERDAGLLREILDKAAVRAEQELVDQPEVQGDVRHTIGSSYLALGLYPQAEEHLRSAVDLLREHATSRRQDFASVLNSLALTLKRTGRLDEAISLYREALDLVTPILNEDEPFRLLIMNNLGQALHHKGEMEAAARLLREALTLAERRPAETVSHRAQLCNNLALLLHDQRDFAGAEPLYQDSLELLRSYRGEADPDIAGTLDNLGMLYVVTGRLDRAEPLLLEAMESRRKVLPSDHPAVASSLNSLAQLYHDRAEYDRAEAFYREALEVLLKRLPDGHPYVASALNNLASLLQEKGDYAAAEPLFRQSLEIRRNLFGEPHPQVAESLNNLAGLLTSRRDFAAAEPLSLEAVAMYRELWGDGHARMGTSLATRAQVLHHLGRHDESEPLFRGALRIWREAHGDAHPLVRRGMQFLGASLQAQDKLTEAEAIHREALQHARAALTAQHPDLAAILADLGETLLAQDRAADAEPLLREAMSARMAALPSDHWERAESMSLLGASLAGQKRFAEAEPLLLDAYDVLANRSDDHPDQTRDAILRLISMYERWDRPADAGAWRAKLDSQSASTNSAR